jgi:hypothetical protein
MNEVSADMVRWKRDYHYAISIMVAKPVYSSTFDSFSIVTNIGVFPKGLLTIVGLAHILTTLLSILFILTGTLSTSQSFIVIVAVPLNIDVG